MPQAGQIISASDVTRARPTILRDVATGNLAASSSVVDIPGISISFTTETTGALFWAVWFVQADPTASGTTAAISARPVISGPSSFSASGDVFSMFSAGGNAGDQGTVGNTMGTTLGDAGTYTVTLKATTAANQQIGVYSSLMVIIQEQWS